MTLRILTVLAHGDGHQALLLSDDDGSYDRLVIDAPTLDAEAESQLVDAYLALMAAAPDLPEQWTEARIVDQLPGDVQPRIVAELRGC